MQFNTLWYVKLSLCLINYVIFYKVLWLIDSLLGNNLETNNVYSLLLCITRINERPFLSNGSLKTFPPERMHMQQ
jgi:hypothetical protein